MLSGCSEFPNNHAFDEFTFFEDMQSDARPGTDQVPRPAPYFRDPPP